MKKFLLSLVVIVGFLLYVFRQKGGGDNTPKIIAPSGSQTTSNTTGQASPGSSSTKGSSSNSLPVSQPTASNNGGGQYKDGFYTGSVTDAYYGNVQVKAIISGGKITDVQFLQSPSDRSTSVYINSQAMPYLTQEAITVQSASVDIVSGATDTSLAFQQSLAAALSQAH